MKTPSTDLFELIRSLTPNEKGYFKKQLVMFRESNISTLFDFIDDMEAYDEEAILEHFKGEKFVQNLSRTKNYLYNVLLQSLRNYNSKIYARIEVRNMIAEIEVLFGKGLYKQCNTHLQHAKKKALKYELFLALIEILVWEMKVVRFVYPSNKIDSAIRQMVEQLDDIQEALADLLKYYKENAKITRYKLLTGSGAIVGHEFEGVLEELNEYRDSELLTLSNPKGTVEADVLRLLASAYIHGKLGEHETSIQVHLEAMQLFEQHPIFKQEHPSHYLDVTNNLGVAYLITQQYNKSLELSKRFDEEVYTIADLKRRAQQFKVNLLSASIVSLKSRKLATQHYAYIEEQWNTYHQAFAPQFRKTITYNMFYLNLGQEQYREALQYLNYIDRELPYELRKDISDSAILGTLVTLAELDDWGLLESKARSLARSNKFESDVWKAVGNAFLRLARGTDVATDEVYATLAEQLEQDTSPSMTAALKNFEMIAWLNCKINGEKFWP